MVRGRVWWMVDGGGWSWTDVFVEGDRGVSSEPVFGKGRRGTQKKHIPLFSASQLSVYGRI